jgi:uncharacterized membrane-anchored protein
MRSAAGATGSTREPIAAKVPEITALFWIIKVLTTGMGEAASDYLGNINVGLAAGVGIVGLVVALRLQFRTRRYEAVVYWFAVMMVAVFGTMAADGLHVALDVPYAVSTAIYAILLVVVFALWHRSEGTLSIHSIVTRRRETYYWLTVFVTFALGTAAGDLTAGSLNLGYFTSGIVFAVVIAIPAIGWWRFGLNPIFGFWFAYVITRPLGASFADWFGKPHSPDGGLGLGDGTVTGISLAVIIVLVGYVAATRRGIQRSPESSAIEECGGAEPSPAEG